MAPTDWHTANENAEAPPSPEQITGLRVYPSFSFYKDRPACEIALTLNAGCVPDDPWPLWMEGPNGVAPVRLERGDGVLYRGIDCPHWRETFHGDHALQVFLFYVDQQGPHAEWKFDKRERLSTFLRPR